MTSSWQEPGKLLMIILVILILGSRRWLKEVNLSRTQLFRKLKAISGLSPNELINDIRLQKAADLIRAKADTLTQISYSVGYNEQSYFAKRFRKKFGVTPGEYQAGQDNHPSGCIATPMI